MRPVPPVYDARGVEASVRAIWSARGLPPADGPLGQGAGPIHRFVVGSVPPGAPDLPSALALVRLDADARYLLFTGARPFGTLRRPLGPEPPEGTEDPAQLLGAWLGGGTLRGAADREAELRRALVERLAADRLLVARSAPVRVCPNCRVPRSPETVIHQSEVGSAYLVRFPLRGEDPPATLLVWVDAPWKLLATAAVGVHPTAMYATVRCRRDGAEERIVVLRSAVDTLRLDLPGTELEVIEERPGSALCGRPYYHPLSPECPSLAELPAPAGTVLPVPQIEEYGTGVLPLAPSHGIGAAEAAERLEIAGWPIVGSDGVLTRTIPNKYAGLPLEDADSFILRDLIDGGSVFAQHPVRRGVPRCAICGTALLWIPARLWYLDPSKLPADRLDQYRRALPGVPVPTGEGPTLWPASAFESPEDPAALPLSECTGCDRLAPDTATGPCACGAGSRHTARRRLLPEFEEAIAAWATVDRFPDGTPVRLFAPARRRGPVLFHHLVALHAGRRRPGEVRVVALPTVPRGGPALDASEPVDALRIALLRLRDLRAGRKTIEGLRRQARGQLRRVWRMASDLLAGLETTRESIDPGPIGPYLGSLLPEDAGFLSCFERMALDVRTAYEAERFADGLDRLLKFFEEELSGRYLRLARVRLATTAPVLERVAALRTWQYAFTRWLELLAPAAPFTAESLWEAVRGPGPSIFEEPPARGGRAPVDAESEAAYRAWAGLAEAIDRARFPIGVPFVGRIPSVGVLVRDDPSAERLRRHPEVLNRILLSEQIEVASPTAPWKGAQLEIRPNLAELQRAFGVQAPRLVRLLQGIPPKRLQEGIRTGGIPIAFEGSTYQLGANYFEVTESLPPRTVPVPWSGGQLLVALPADAAPPPERPMPALSLDAYRVVLAIRRRLRRLPIDHELPEVVVRCDGPLGDELERAAPALALALHVPTVRRAGAEEALPEGETTRGRSGRGARWAVRLPGVPRPTRLAKGRRRPTAPTRAPVPPTAPVVPDELLEFLGDDLRNREQGVRGLIERFDVTPIGPALGPSKVAVLWELGLHSPEAVATAPFELVAALPGFGPILARELVRSAGGEPPPPPPRPIRRTAAVVLEPEFPAGAAPTEPPTVSVPAPGPIESGPVAVPATILNPPAEADRLPPPVAPPSVAAEALAREIPESISPIVPDVPPSDIADPPVPPPTAPAPAEVLVPDPPPAPGPADAPAPDAPGPVNATPDAERPIGVEAELPEATSSPSPIGTDGPPAGEVPAEDGEAPPEAAVTVEAAPAEEGVQLEASEAGGALWTRFLEATAAGHKGLCLTRESPDRLRIYLGARAVEVVWISPIARPGSVRPSDLLGIGLRIRTAIESGGVTAVFLEGIEYLVSLHSADRTLPVLREIDALARAHRARVWVPVNPILLPGPELDELRLGLAGPVGASTP